MAIASSYALATSGTDFQIDTLSARKEQPRQLEGFGASDRHRDRHRDRAGRALDESTGGEGDDSPGGSSGRPGSGLLGASGVVRTGSGKPKRAWHALRVDTDKPDGVAGPRGVRNSDGASSSAGAPPPGLGDGSVRSQLESNPYVSRR